MISQEILSLTDRQIQLLLRETEMNDLCICLKGFSREVQEKIFKNMSTRAVILTGKTIDALGKIDSQTIEEYCKAFVQQAQKIKDS